MGGNAWRGMERDNNLRGEKNVITILFSTNIKHLSSEFTARSEEHQLLSWEADTEIPSTESTVRDKDKSQATVSLG